MNKITLAVLEKNNFAHKIYLNEPCSSFSTSSIGILKRIQKYLHINTDTHTHTQSD